MSLMKNKKIGKNPFRDMKLGYLKSSAVNQADPMRVKGSLAKLDHQNSCTANSPNVRSGHRIDSLSEKAGNSKIATKNARINPKRKMATM